ncbi:glycoside hydrolase family protein, partial [Escherichia coli]|nr:glycoside hydrolase family protein [Escherichia coli]
MNAKIRYGLSAAVLALIGAGASAPEILDQFLDEKEGNHTTAYRDGAGIWTICRGAILVDGKPVVPGMKLSKEKCDQVNAIERDKALAWVEKNIRVNRPGFPGECFICELRLPDHRFRWKHNKLFLLLPEEYGPAFP